MQFQTGACWIYPWEEYKANVFTSLKAVTFHFRDNMQLAGGSLQTCSGIPSVIEAAVHANEEDI